MGSYHFMKSEIINNVNEDTAFGFNTNPINNGSDSDSNGFEDYTEIFNYYGEDLFSLSAKKVENGIHKYSVNMQQTYILLISQI